MDAEKIQNFIVYNFEKAIVVVVIGLSGFLVYSGMGKVPITKKKDPIALKDNANRVKLEVDEDHSEAIIPDREPTTNIAAELSKFLRPIPVTHYAPSNPMDRNVYEENKVRREDPELFAPSAVRTVAVASSMAFRSFDGTYALADLDPADEVEKVEKRPVRKPKRNRGAEMMMDSGMDEMMESMMEMTMDASPMVESDDSSGPIRTLKAEYDKGFRPVPTQALTNGAEELPVPGPGIFIAGTAVVPHKQLIDSYKEALADAAEYSPLKRDKPIYVAYEVQRADVTDKSVEELQDSDWIVRDSHLTTTINAARYWSGFATETVPNDYRIAGFTMWVPPVMLDDHSYFSSHPLIPMKSQREMQQEKLIKEAEKANIPIVDDETKFEFDNTGTQTGAGGGMYGESMMDSYEDMGGDEGYGMMSMGGEGASTFSMKGKPAEENPVDFKLIRFYDFFFIKGAKPDDDRPKFGRKYVYRVRYGINDPNFPKDETLQPQTKSLAPEAYERTVSLVAKARQEQKRDSTRWSEWSDPSAVSMLPPFDRAVVGPVKADKVRTGTIGNRTVMIETESPKAEVVTESLDPGLGTFVPAVIEAEEGTVLSAEAEKADVVDPITLEIKKVENPTVKSAATIIDIQGGLPIDFAEDERIFEPGVFLMMDSLGNLKVRDSTEDQMLYRIRSYAEERGLE